MSTSAAEVQAEMRGHAFASEFSTSYEPVLDRIEKAAETAAEEASELIATSTEISIAREGAKTMQELAENYTLEARKITDNAMWSPTGAAEQTRLLKERTAAETENVLTRSLEKISELASRFPEKTFPPPTVEQSAELQLILAQGAVQGPLSILRTSSDVLRRASDPATPAADRERYNARLRGAYSQLVGRIAETADAGPLLPVAEKMIAAIEQHLNVVRGKPAHEVARDTARRISDDFGFIRSQSEVMPWDILRLGCPDLFPPEE